MATFAAVPLLWLISRGFSGPFSQAAARERAGDTAVTSVIEENLANHALVQAFGGDLAHHRITLGGLLAFAAFSAYLYPLARHLSGLPVTAAEAAASGRRITEILHAKPAVADGARRLVPSRPHGRIEGSCWPPPRRDARKIRVRGNAAPDTFRPTEDPDGNFGEPVAARYDESVGEKPGS